ncbi:hypothetical protein GCM10017783_23690 [Deinococcus piscis]|uniref:Uncharacterized protein n=1 Tax=Deinococcus piscis TaxID=394230 RepID=A0ABQ3KAR2_9DEIO|nr:hypothetical protein [Deinococcus piscis]GHG10504.1 hypothetical protein GCM10017783_23690 [Deinococcus piscis]
MAQVITIPIESFTWFNRRGTDRKASGVCGRAGPKGGFDIAIRAIHDTAEGQHSNYEIGSNLRHEPHGSPVKLQIAGRPLIWQERGICETDTTAKSERRSPPQHGPGSGFHAMSQTGNVGSQVAQFGRESIELSDGGRQVVRERLQ